jgi:type II secretory pathway component GspD/PulD (secretin)
VRRDWIDIVLACFAAGTLATHAASQDANAPAERVSADALAGESQPETAQPDTGTGSLDEPFVFGPFTEALDITAFVEYVAETLNINISRDSTLAGQVAFNSGVEITKRDLLPLLDARLEELGYTITLDSMGFYTIIKSDKVPLGGPETTKFISTPGVRPSSLRTTISTQLGISTQPGGQQVGGVRISYEDELGVIIMTDSPRRIAAVESLVEAFIEQRASLVTRTIPLTHISAPQAKQRAEQLLAGETNTNPLNQFNQGDPSQLNNNQTSGSGSLSNRLTVDASGNNLIFRGLEAEFEEIRSIIEAVDMPSQLTPKVYYTGSSTRAVAEFAEKNGLGEVDIMSTSTSTNSNQQNFFRQQQQQNNFQNLGADEPEISGGSRMLVDEGRGRVIYFATPQQQDIFATLVEQFDAEDEEIVVETYKLEYADAEEVADILQALIERTRPQTGPSTFLPTSNQNQPRTFVFPNGTNNEQADESDVAGFNPDPETSFVIADVGNNQIIITSPRSQQKEFAQLIERVDLRRAQVYIEAIIVAVSDTDSFRLAIESQFLDLNGSDEGGGLRTNFGLSALDVFTNSTTVATGLGGFTGALINDDFIPLIINATETDSNSRVVATPQLLVDDNSEATVLTSQEVPYQSTSRTDVSELTSFEFVTAETSLTVTPQISAGGTIRMDYEILLEAFNGTALEGAPPPKQTNNIAGESVTVPSDSTVVIGGLVLESEGETIIKVPLFGDIPWVGHLFKDTNTDGRKTTLYVFLKPRVLRDPSWRDHRLLTRGPQQASGLEYDIPELPPIMMESTYVNPSSVPQLNDDGTPRIGLPSETDPNIDQQDLKREDD